MFLYKVIEYDKPIFDCINAVKQCYMLMMLHYEASIAQKRTLNNIKSG